MCDDRENVKVLFNGNPPQLSLQGVTQSLTNEVLEKEEQSGNWLTRPLRESQLKYAAQDAYFTLKCYRELQQRFKQELG